MKKTYTVKGNRTAADVIGNNDEIIEVGLDMQTAQRIAICAQKFEGWITAWAEPDERVSTSKAQGVVVEVRHHPVQQAQAHGNAGLGDGVDAAVLRLVHDRAAP